MSSFYRVVEDIRLNDVLKFNPSWSIKKVDTTNSMNLTDGNSNGLWIDVYDGLITGFTRYGSNNPSFLLDVVGTVISEYDMNEPEWYLRYDRQPDDLSLHIENVEGNSYVYINGIIENHFTGECGTFKGEVEVDNSGEGHTQNVYYTIGGYTLDEWDDKEYVEYLDKLFYKLDYENLTPTINNTVKNG